MRKLQFLMSQAIKISHKFTFVNFKYDFQKKTIESWKVKTQSFPGIIFSLISIFLQSHVSQRLQIILLCGRSSF